MLAGGAYRRAALLGIDDLTDEERATAPSWFLDSVSHDGPAGVVVATAHWEHVLPGILDDAITLFRERAVGTHLARESGGHIVLVYVLRSEGTKPFVCWYGYPATDRLDNPTPASHRPGFKADLTQVSERLRTFYTQLHNRFELVGFGHCGLLPLNELFTLDGAADEYEYEGDDPDQAPDPGRLLPIFTSSNVHLCVELGTENAWNQDDCFLDPRGELWPNLNELIRHFTEEMAEYVEE
jgi:hypothetical protein